MNTIISPSLLAADFLNLESELKRVSNSGADWLHLDVMDGHFVPNLTFGYDLVSKINNVCDMFLDVHLMMTNPTDYIEQFIKAGSDLITIHFESFANNTDLITCLEMIKKADVKAGLSIKPSTPVAKIIEFIDLVDLVLVMSVEPGFGGQVFDINAVEKIKELAKFKKNGKLLIEVDGGINSETSKLCTNAGCDVLVAGSYLFNGDMKELVSTLK